MNIFLTLPSGDDDVYAYPGCTNAHISSQIDLYKILISESAIFILRSVIVWWKVNTKLIVIKSGYMHNILLCDLN